MHADSHGMDFICPNVTQIKWNRLVFINWECNQILSRIVISAYDVLPSDNCHSFAAVGAASNTSTTSTAAASCEASSMYHQPYSPSASPRDDCSPTIELRLNKICKLCFYARQKTEFYAGTTVWVSLRLIYVRNLVNSIYGWAFNYRLTAPCQQGPPVP